jgi:CBS domain containing-hemolysin-like protein
MLIFTTAVAVALVVSFLCSIFESVLLSVGPARVAELTIRGKRAGALLEDFKRRIDTPIAAILILNTIAHTIGATVAGASYVEVFDEQSLWIFSLLFTIAVLVFTEIIPKTLGVTHARTLAVPVAYAIHVLTVALRPLVAVTGSVSRALRGAKSPPITSVEEIRLLAALGRNEGVVGARTAGIIVGATQLSRLRAADVVVPRHRVKFVSGTQSLADVLRTIKDSGHSRFPFSPSGQLDDATGIVLAKELLLQLREQPAERIDWESLLREPLLIPASKPLNALLRDFKQARKHLAVVVDEYGDIEGIVTLEDVLEELVGDIVDESDRPAQDLWVQDDGSIHALGTAELRKVCDRLGLEWKRDEDVATLGGLVTALLGRVPVKGDSVEWNGYRLEVLRSMPRRAELVSVTRIR